MKRFTRYSLGALAGILAIPVLALAATPDLNVDEKGVGIHGYDPVAYFTVEKAVKGSSDITHAVNGVTYHFASTESRDLFAASPEKYAPQFGGFCAMGTAMGMKLDVDPEAWRVVDGKLYLNLNPEVQTRWLSDVPGHLRQAEAKWAEIRDIPAADLQ